MEQNNTEYQVIWLVRRLFRALAQLSNEHLRELDISSADRAVMEFLFPDARLSVPQIARRYQVSRQHVQVTINRLLEMKLLVSEENPRHKRSSLIALTKEGMDLFGRIREGEDEVVDRLFSKITKNELQVTRKTLETLLGQLQKDVHDV